MNWKIVSVLLSFTLIIGCGSKDNFIVLSPSNDGSVGALQIENQQGASVLEEEGKAIYIANNTSTPSAPTDISDSETEAFFKHALTVHPLIPKSFLLYFEFNSKKLTEESLQKITDIQQSITERNSVDIAIIGHTDRTGEDEYNQHLSLQRARAVYDILINNTVRAENVTITYHGEGNPLIPTADNVAEPKNRRVEVMIR